jgi:hypothetical protein
MSGLSPSKQVGPSKWVDGLTQWLSAPAPAERLGLLRIAISGFVTIYLAANAAEFSRLVTASAAAFDPVGLARLLNEPVSSELVWVGFALLLVLGALATVGWRYRIVGPLFGLGVLAWTSYHSSWGQLLHFEHLFTLHLLVLSFAPAADAVAIDARRTPVPTDDVRYGWPVRLLAIATVATYFLSGFAKLRHTGLAWFDPDTLRNHIAYSASRIDLVGGPTPPLARIAVDRSWLLAPMAAAGLAVELGAPLALAWRRFRNWWLGSAILFHLGTAATMLVFFGYRGLGVGLLPLLPVERAKVAWESRRA